MGSIDFICPFYPRDSSMDADQRPNSARYMVIWGWPLTHSFQWKQAGWHWLKLDQNFAKIFSPRRSQGGSTLVEIWLKCLKKLGICLRLQSTCYFFTLNFFILLASASYTNQIKKSSFSCLGAKPNSRHILAQNEQFYNGFSGKK